MALQLVLVESKEKARTLERLLGPSYAVRAVPREIKALPRLGLGIDTERGFVADYRVLPSCRRLLRELRAAAGQASRIWLAFDPDGEGEALARQFVEELVPVGVGRVRRARCPEITRPALEAAFASAGAVDRRQADAYQARAILDRLVARALFAPLLRASREPSATPENGRLLAAALGLLGAPASPTIPRARRERRRRPPPFVASTLLLEASRVLGLRPAKALALAGRLYDGSAFDGTAGLIRFPRAESPILPTDLTRTPEKLAGSLTPEELALYRLVFERFVASGTSPAGAEEEKNGIETVPGAEPLAPADEGELVAELCRLGIARFAADPALAAVGEARAYIHRSAGRLRPSRLGAAVGGWLRLHVPELASRDGAASLAARLDAIEGGGETPFSVLDGFWRRLQPALARARAEGPLLDRPPAAPRPPERRRPREIGVSCPRCDGGRVVEREAEGRLFYGCSRYPACRFTSSDRLVAESCPRCGQAYLLVRETRRYGRVFRCGRERCRYRRTSGAQARERGSAG